MMGDLLKSTD